MKINRSYAVPVLVAGLALLLGSAPQDRTKEKVQNVEVKEYKGEKLDSIKNFEENSINGPQHIDITKYSLKIVGLVNKAWSVGSTSATCISPRVISSQIEILMEELHEIQ